MRADEDTHRSGASLWDAVALSGLDRVATTWIKLREGKLGVKSPGGRRFSTSPPVVMKRVPPQRCSACPGAAPTTRPCRKSADCGTHSSLSIRTLLTETPPSAIVRRAAPLLADSPLATNRSVIASGPARLELGHGRLSQRGRQGRLVQLGQLPPAEQRATGVFHRVRRGLTVHQRGQLLRESALGGALVRPRLGRLRELGQLLGRQEGEPLQVAAPRRRRRC